MDWTVASCWLRYNSPILFSLVLEVVHVAALVDVHAILGFPLLCLAQVHDLATVLHDKLALLKGSGRHHSATFVGETLNFKAQTAVITGCQAGLNFFFLFLKELKTKYR